MRKRITLFLILISMMISINAAFAQSNEISIKPYGFFKFDMAYDNSRTNNGNYVFWLLNESENKDEFNMTARQTRLGANFSYSEYEGKTVTGRFECDFYGGGAENKNFLMLRHGFLKIDFGKYYLLAGQTSDVISPLVPATVNYTVMWNSGNIGYRRPQLQIGSTAEEGLAIAAAVSRNISGDIDGDGNDDGEDNPFPSFQARISALKPGKYDIGISGHYGRMEYMEVGDKENYDSYSANLHFKFFFTNSVSLSGEMFTGKTLNQYNGGLGQGYNLLLAKGVESSGGWICTSIRSTEKVNLNFGYGIDNPKEDCISAGYRNRNQSIYANLFANVAYKTSLGIEFTHLTTGYYDGNDTENISGVRIQTSLIMKF